MRLAANFLPEKISKKFFGDRKKYGLIPDKNDSDWILWEKEYLNFYDTTQKKGLGSYINDSGYKILKGVDLTELVVCEIGPGSLPHRRFWSGTPKKYIGVDINQDFLDLLPQKANCPFEQVKIESGAKALPLPSKSIDILLSFYSFEHLNPLGANLDEYERILKTNGRIIGAIPNEGGFAWGLGRYLTSRRWIHANTQINYDKIICWEHPNFADKILGELNRRFSQKQVSHFPPLSFPSLNSSLVTKFIYEKS